MSLTAGIRCPRCAALIEDEYEGEHAKWHASLVEQFDDLERSIDSVIESLERQIGRLRTQLDDEFRQVDGKLRDLGNDVSSPERSR